MTFWRNIATLAARRLDMAECQECPPGLPGQDPAFSTAVTALGAKLAKADGSADGDEYAAFAEVFHPDPESENNIHRLYDLARQTTHGFESYAKRLAKRYRTCPQILEDVLDGLFHIAKADGAVTQDELSYLERVADLFGMSPLSFRRLTATHVGTGPDDPYRILDVPADADLARGHVGGPPRPRPGPRPAAGVHRGGRGQVGGDQRRLQHGDARTARTGRSWRQLGCCAAHPRPPIRHG
ncbi:MAG: TerB family tellurite resistance protein [Burkholderiales bacterium]|nr:TerB family tellurite resistance protein [Burkholderiales bacterium]